MCIMPIWLNLPRRRGAVPEAVRLKKFITQNQKTMATKKAVKAKPHSSRVINVMTFALDPEKHGSRPGGISITVPNEALSPAQILTNWSRGLGIAGMKLPMWDPDADFDSLDLSKIRDYDFAIQEDVINSLRAQIENKKAVLKEQDALNKKAKDEIAARERKLQQAADTLLASAKDGPGKGQEKAPLGAK